MWQSRLMRNWRWFGQYVTVEMLHKSVKGSEVLVECLVQADQSLSHPRDFCTNAPVAPLPLMSVCIFRWQLHALMLSWNDRAFLLHYSPHTHPFTLNYLLSGAHFALSIRPYGICSSNETLPWNYPKTSWVSISVMKWFSAPWHLPVTRCFVSFVMILER